MTENATAMAKKVLVVFDYDWSLINENSDTYVFRQLHPDLLQTLKERIKQSVSWTKLMDDLLGELAAQKPDVDEQLIRSTLAAIPVQDRMLDALRLAAVNNHADVKIVSDANTVYIDCFLQHHGLTDLVSETFTNPASFDDDRRRLHVAPFHPLNQDPHGCELCPTNLCKGAVLDKILAAQKFDHVLYIGDGGGDFCPSTHLTKNDIVFARGNREDGSSFGLLSKIQANQDKVQAKVVEWTTGCDIYREFETFFKSIRET